MRDIVVPNSREDVRLKDPPKPLLLLPPKGVFSGGEAVTLLPAPMRPANFFHLPFELDVSNTASVGTMVGCVIGDIRGDHGGDGKADLIGAERRG